MTEHTAVVAGDITIDWMLAKPRDLTAPPPHWTSEVKAAAFRQVGGAGLLAELVRRDAAARGRGEDRWRICGPALTTERLRSKKLSADDPDYDHAFSIWQPFPERAGEEPVGTRWRISEFQGWNDQPRGERRAYALGEDDPEADVVVLIDAGLGFRNWRQLWPSAIQKTGARPRWVILRLTYTEPAGELWDHLLDNFADRLIVITSVRDLRQMHAQISSQLSWERTAQEAAWEIVNGSQLRDLSHCAWIAASIGESGAVLLPGRTGGSDPARLVFDPKSMEDEWEGAFEGTVLGSSTCMTAAVAHAVMDAVTEEREPPDLETGLKRGIAAQRRLREVGYGAGPLAGEAGGSLPETLDFPFGDVVDVLRDRGAGEGSSEVCHLATVAVDTSSAGDGDWTILAKKHPKNLDELAIRIVEEGIESSLSEVPISKFSRLVTVDRHEIESVRSVARLIAEYCRRDERAPLCIAVFGPPGAGKSFAVKEVAEHTLPGRVTPIEFNLSQFEKPENLFEALHRVRDVNLSGKMPLVVWDEFDTAQQGVALGWLRYFLQPMQDGTFQQGEITHPIGRCIFIFAGGTADHMTSFTEDLDSEPSRAAKKRDFVSRLHGYMDVLGPNRHSSRGPEHPDWEKDDPYFIIRRAVILRSIFKSRNLQLKHSGKVNVDPGVLRAFLKARRYKHGVRSMMSIVKMSLLADAKAFVISSLPPSEQLDLHVTGDFLDLARNEQRKPARLRSTIAS